MPVEIEESTVRLIGHCTIEEAEPLHDMLRQIDAPMFDLTRATHLHTAIVQLMLASSGPVRGLPPDLVLSACFHDRLPT